MTKILNLTEYSPHDKIYEKETCPLIILSELVLKVTNMKIFNRIEDNKKIRVHPRILVNFL